MKKLLTILALLFCLKAKCQSQEQWAALYIDTVKCVFKVSSTRYSQAQIIAKRGYIVRLVIVYTGDRMPCDDCDYSDKHRTIAYLDTRKKQFTESQYHVWEVEVIRE